MKHSLYIVCSTEKEDEEEQSAYIYTYISMYVYKCMCSYNALYCSVIGKQYYTSVIHLKHLKAISPSKTSISSIESFNIMCNYIAQSFLMLLVQTTTCKKRNIIRLTEKDLPALV